MDNLKDYSTEKIIELLKKKKISGADLTDSGICPTCFNREHDGVVFGNDKENMIYEDKDIECFFVGNPRAEGHIAISSKKHFKDMMELDDELCKKVFVFSKQMMNIIKYVYDSESVYLCTMCDGPMNHFHVQLIPRYEYEKRGSSNFVKPRSNYKHDPVKLEKIKKLIPNQK